MKLFYAYGNVILIVGLIILLIFIAAGYTKEALQKSGSQSLWYQNIGKAINKAYETDAFIVEPSNYKYAQGMWFDLMLKTHPYYHHNKDLKIVLMNDIKNKCKDTRREKLSFLTIKEDDYNIVSLKEFCLSFSE